MDIMKRQKYSQIFSKNFEVGVPSKHMKFISLTIKRDGVFHITIESLGLNFGEVNLNVADLSHVL